MHKFAEGGLVASRNKIAQQIYIGSSCAFIHALTTAFYYRSRRSWRSFRKNLKDLYPVETGNPVVDLGVGWLVVILTSVAKSGEDGAPQRVARAGTV
jgi:hypothetical protein